MVRSPLRPDASIQKALISTPSRLTGELDAGFYLITHAWPDFSERSWLRTGEGPSSRSAYVFTCRTESPDENAIFIPDYSALGPTICSYLAVIYGKRFDSHGLIEGSGRFHVPEQSHYSRVCDHNLPFNSHSPRSDLKIELNLEEAKVITPLLDSDSSIGAGSFLKFFQGASKFYLQALQNFELDPEVAYLHLITAIEILSGFYEYHESDLIDEELTSYLTRIRSEMDGGDRIANAVKLKIYSVRKKFLKTVMDLLHPAFFTGGESLECYEKLNADDIDKRILAAYDLRSRYVHTGVPFGRWISLTGRAEVQIGT